MINYYIDGVNDLHFQELLGYQRINDEIEQVMRRFGYKPILTPNFEYYDMYAMDKSLSRDKMFKLIDKNGKVMVLRPDATIPICRMAANTFKNPEEVLKFSYITTIFREDNSKTNYRKDFIQGGVEYFGNSGPECDGEIIAVAITMLLNLGLEKIHIDVGQAAFLDGLFDGIDLTFSEKERINELIENKNLGDLKLYLGQLNITDEIYETMLKIPMLFGSYEDVMKKARELCLNGSMEAALDHVESVYEILSIYGLENYINLDFGFTNQLDYYSGLIFKGYAENWGDSILSGGRYDNLSKTFGVDRPATGFGINISLLMEIIGREENSQDYFDVLIRYENSMLSDALSTASLLRDLEFSTDIIDNKYIYSEENYRFVLMVEKNGIFISDKDDKIPTSIEKFMDILKGDISL
ncbi:ATP phosphoribosyltransferase regulatory subunit [Alkalibacter mobilis]|uniref:ATP phosphoribosyltransferase regulatory subunit n=1 Tax=Alkalibacter mobilis TaxID=2787712 RepID=UPI00189CFDC1|nr:ATP phosphoribosyltransferase regulatory subunit [Alkalibacter mobilis]MBF7097814.1 ATP phosphoribosyltransferase regulatory subunit [Alkalibacter mobilis]